MKYYKSLNGTMHLIKRKKYAILGASTSTSVYLRKEYHYKYILDTIYFSKQFTSCSLVLRPL